MPAAGASRRVGGPVPKPYLDLLGRSVLEHSLRALLAHPGIAGGVVVLAADDNEWPRQPADLRQRVMATVGGRERCDSVLNGLRALAADADDWVLVHDAARPCLSNELLDRLIDRLGEDDVGGLLACRISDTIKSADMHNRVSETRPRDGLWGAQTPQMFRRGLLERALSETDAGEITDEASAVERLGYQPLLIESDIENLKVTFAGDLRLAETILKSRKDN